MGLEDVLIDNSDVEDDFRSCCAEEDVWQESQESLIEGYREELDENSLRMFFKGVSSNDEGVCRVSGIGVVMERSPGIPLIQVQKKLDLYVEGLVAEHLALMDGLLAALQSGVRRVYAFTDSEKVYYQIAEAEILDDQLLVALGHRILELAEQLEDFDLQLVSSFELERPLILAQKAIGALVNCHVCCEEKLSSKIIKLNCSHKVCSDCMIMHVECKLRATYEPIRCPKVRCKHFIKPCECKSFLPITTYKLLERASISTMQTHGEYRHYCAYPNCSGIIEPQQQFSSRGSSSSQLDNNCVECPECRRDVCTACDVPWHSLVTCEEYQNLPAEERDAEDSTLDRLAQSNRWRCCQQCRRIIELTEGCHYITCRCGHEFCYSCGAEYRNGVQTCHCAFWDNENVETSIVPSSRETELWTWESFESLPAAVDGYSEQERAQLALIQRFLAGGFSFGDHHGDHQAWSLPPPQSDSYTDTMKDLHHLPWLERFVSVISDNYHEDFMQ